MSWIKNLFLVFASLMLAMLIMEGALHFIWKNPYQNTEVSKIIELRMQSPNVNREYDRSWLDPNDSVVTFRVNKNRFILPANQHEDPVKTIMFMGGSTTECAAVAEDKRFPNYVSKLFVNDFLSQ